MASRRRPLLRRLVRRLALGAVVAAAIAGLREVALRRHEPPPIPVPDSHPSV